MGFNDSATPNASMVNDSLVFIEDLLTTSLGPRCRNLPEAIILTIIYTIILITGVFGNVCTCLVIAKNNYMHTATNYYLFSLAISDVLTLILGLPPELFTIWQEYPWIFGEPFCVFKIFLSEMTSSASVLTITAFTMERYVAICHPIRAQTLSNLSRAIKTIFFIWIAACCFALPYPIHARTFYYVFHPTTNQPIPDSLICNIPSEYRGKMKYMFQISTFMLFIAPMTIISVLYIMIGLTLRKASLARQASNHSSSNQIVASQSRKSVLKMLVAVVVAFFICWAPFHSQRLMTLFIPSPWPETLMEIGTVLFYISGVLYFVSSTVNPILYNLMSRKYRSAFKETLCRCMLRPEERRFLRDGHGRIYSERSQSCIKSPLYQTTKIVRGQTLQTLRQDSNSSTAPINANEVTNNRWSLGKTRLLNEHVTPVEDKDCARNNGKSAISKPLMNSKLCNGGNCSGDSYENVAMPSIQDTSPITEHQVIITDMNTVENSTFL